MGSYPAGAFPAEAFLWDSGTVTPLGMPEGATNSTANAISNTGIICGHYSYPNSQGPGGYARRALAWIDGSMTDLGVLPGFVQSMAFDVNDAGEIVGYCSNPPLLGGNSKAFLWRNGVMTALDSVLAPQSPQYQVKFAYGINASGQIAATVKPPQISSVRAALLTPVPPLPGDTNCDWMVNTTDLLTVINGWGPCQKGTSCPGNLNDDDFVNVADLLMVINNWGP